MEGDSLAKLAYLVLLGSAILGYMILQNRHRLAQIVQQAMVWFFIFVGAIFAVGLWDDLRGTVMPRQASLMSDGRISVPREFDGHYYLTLTVNGTPVRFVVDTGATDIVLTQRDAARVGLNPDGLTYFGEAATANGVVRTARVRLDSIAFENVVDRRVRAWVNAGEMETSLLGMAYLQRFERIEIANDTLNLFR
jgi:aspartyl protease family protein